MLLPIVAPAGVTELSDLIVILLVTCAAFSIAMMAGEIGKLLASPRSASILGRSAASAIGATGM